MKLMFCVDSCSFSGLSLSDLTEADSRSKESVKRCLKTTYVKDRVEMKAHVSQVLEVWYQI